MVERSRQRDTKAVSSEALRDTGLTISALCCALAMGDSRAYYDIHWFFYKN